MLDQFSATVEKIYAAAGGNCTWQDALRAIEDYTGSTGAVLNLVPKGPSAPPQAIAGSFSQSDCAEYAQNFMWRCPRIAFAQNHPDILIHYDQMILTEAEMDRDATYAWYGKHGLRYYVAGWIGESSDHRAYMSLQRSRRQGHVEPEQVEQFALILKHMAHALALAVELGTLEQQCRFGLAFLDSLPQAVFALDGSGLVRFANDRARRLLAVADGLAIEDGRLTTALAADQSRLDALIAGSTSAIPATCGGWSRVARPSGRLPYALFVAPLANDDEEFLAGNCRVLVLVHDFAEARPIDTDMLRSMYGLTQTESHVASALVSGHSVESAAALLNMQIATARSHLKAIFAKMGVHRQQDLVRILTSLASMRF